MMKIYMISRKRCKKIVLSKKIMQLNNNVNFEILMLKYLTYFIDKLTTFVEFDRSNIKFI